MKPRLPGFENSWVHKAISLLFMTTSLQKNEAVKKWTFGVHLAILPFQVMFVCQNMYTAILEMIKDFNLGRLVTSLNYGFLFNLGMVGTYTFIFMGTKASTFIEHLDQQLHCSSDSIERSLWKKYVPTFKFFYIFYMAPVYFGWVFMIILSPLFRFALQTSKAPTYILFPIWYPVDVLSFGKLFWAAYIYEAMVCLNCCKCFGDINATLLYTLLWTRVRFEMLGEFFKTVISNRKDRLLGEKRDQLIAISLPEKRRKNLMHSSTRKCYSAAKRSSGMTNSNVEMYKKGFEDWVILWRQTKLLSSTFKVYVNAFYVVAIINNVTMTFATTYILRNTDLPLWHRIKECWLFLYYAIAGLSQLFAPCFLGTLLKDSHDVLRTSIRENNWITETVEVQKLLCMFEKRLCQPLSMKVFNFVKIDLKSFRKSLSVSYTCFSFLFKMSTPLTG